MSKALHLFAFVLLTTGCTKQTSTRSSKAGNNSSGINNNNSGSNGANLISALELPQGSGFAGATAQPGSSLGGDTANVPVIAHWDVVPYQTFSNKFNVGVLAYHVNGVQRVDFSADGGPWVSVYEATPNPQTKGTRPEHTAVEEYWVTLDATKYRTGPVEIRAIAYPKGAGLPTVLQGTTQSYGKSSLILNADPSLQLRRETRYATKNGLDTNDCKTLATACQSITAAVYSAAINKNIDGAQILLGEGVWRVAENFAIPAWTGNALYNTNRWMTISSIPGANPKNVIFNGMDGPGDSAGFQLKLVHFKNMSFTQGVGMAPWNFEDYMWFDNVSFRNPTTVIPHDRLRLGQNYMPQGYAPISVYITDVHMDDMGDGPRGAVLARNVYADRTGGGHASQSETVVNYTTNIIFGSNYPFAGGTGIDYHGDLYQMWGRSENIILYGLRTTPGAWTSSRGIVGGITNIKNIAIVKSNIEIGGGSFAFSFCAHSSVSIDNFIVKESRFAGASAWCAEGDINSLDPTRLTNVLIDRSVFNDGVSRSAPYSKISLPGVRVLQ